MGKVLQRPIGFKLPDYSNISTVVIVGCGGNGSHLVPDLARFMSTLSSKISLILVDGDIVEEKNLIRQHFVSEDIGRNKAEVLSERYGGAFDIDIGFVPEYLTKENFRSIFRYLVHPSLIITCTDNLKSRKLVSTLSGDIWIDLGNEESGGQVTFSYLTWADPSPYCRQKIEDKSAFPIPHVFELFPDYEARLLVEKEVIQPSCAEIAEESPEQIGFVNANCAIIAKNWVHALFTRTPILTHQVFFSIDNTFEHRTITKSVIDDWIQKYPRFSIYSA